MNRYGNGKVYKLVNYIDGEIYVGSTCLSLSKRPCNTKEELRANSPSKKDGLPFAQEVKYQRSTCAFMQDAGVKLKMPQLSIATAIVFFS